jgi:hypothetical protein
MQLRKIEDMDGVAVGIQFDGLSDLLVALKTFEPDVYERLRVSLRDSMRKVSVRAKMSHKAKHSIAVRPTGRSVGASLVAMPGPRASKNDWSAPETRAVIFEFAATSKKPQAKAAIASFESRFGSPGRFLWAAYDAEAPAVNADILSELNKAQDTLQRRLDR